MISYNNDLSLIKIQEKVQESMLGRVFGLMGAMYSGFLPVGMAIFGPLADMISLQLIMVGSGIALILVTVYLQAKSKLDLQSDKLQYIRIARNIKTSILSFAIILLQKEGINSEQ